MNDHDELSAEEAAYRAIDCVWYLLRVSKQLETGDFTFPDGDTWTRQQFAEFKASGKSTLNV